METKNGNASLEDIIKEIGSLSDVKKLPPYVQELLKKNLESVSKINCLYSLLRKIMSG